MSVRRPAAKLALVVHFALQAQTPCPSVQAYTHCDIVFDLTGAEAGANPYWTVDLQAEFRSPRKRTFLLPAFWDDARRMVIRFTPTEPGAWDYRVSGNVARFNGTTGAVTATASDSPGFVKTANVHHFAYTENFTPHLWMGDTVEFRDPASFERRVDTRAAQKFNHLRGPVAGGFPQPDRADPAHFRALDERILYMNRKGVVADLVLDPRFPTWQQRERYIRYLVARYSALNITWQAARNFEEHENGRELLKEIGLLLKKLDPYQHPRSTGGAATSAPLLDDGWMDFVTHDSADPAVGAVEHQLYPVSFVGSGLADRDPDAFRRRLWNAAMNGQYASADLPLDSPAAKQMTIFHDFFLATRHWDLEPYFDVDGGRALALEGVEYIVYLEKPGFVEVLTEKHSYDVAWFNPATGEYLRQKKDWKGEKFSGDPPDTKHDWVLHLSREGKKESMLKSYKFEARRIMMQEVEQNTPKVPFEIAEPAGDTISLSKPAAFSARLKRESRATRTMLWLWTAEVMTEGQGYRVAGTGPKGTLNIPRGIARNLPATLHLRLTGLNANGKAYSTDKIYKLTQ